MGRDIFEDIAAILHPMATRLGVRPRPDEEEEFTADRRETLEQQDRVTRELFEGWEQNGTDPLLAALRRQRSLREDAEEKIRLLLAYGREFPQPGRNRTYTLDALAKAAGMSISGVRTAYDLPHVVDVARFTGARLRPGYKLPEDFSPMTEEESAFFDKLLTEQEGKQWRGPDDAVSEPS
ncbi:hypothetical protein [Krasilnikovia sp. MM14-A1259]|uniref:hypothetical protein n=1 Tax=Krasilnikovia sp. MM14-A1259 TaxID=3373539 RepID=UPI00399CC5D6